MEFPENLKYTSTHEWVRIDGRRCRVGVTAFAAQELSDVVFVDLPQEGKKAGAGEEVCVVESVKAASSIYAPVSGTIKAVNTALSEKPELLNQSCYEKGWIYEIEIDNESATADLLTSQAYAEKIAQEE